MLKLSITNIPADMTADELDNIISGLYEDRRADLARIKNEKSRRESAFAGLALQRMLESEGFAAEDIRIVKNKYGKPYLEKSGRAPLFFNISHSHGVCVCVLSDSETGVDVEAMREFDLKIAKRCFHRAEYDYLMQFAGDEQQEKFCHIWTMKESYLKFTGRGMSIPLSAFCVDAENMKISEITGAYECPSWDEVSFLKPEAPEGYVISVCGIFPGN